MQQRVKEFLSKRVDSSWIELLREALLQLDPNYLEFILKNTTYIPNQDKILNAFKTLPKQKVKYILFGQDPYPREQSAIGYAFIDGAVKNIFSQNGLSKEVNRATSLRNFIKMALVAQGKLTLKDTSQRAIAKLDKSELIATIDELKDNFEKQGVLLLNTALLFTNKQDSKKHIKAWEPFTKHLLENIDTQIELILFGNHAKDILKKFTPKQKAIELPHPYNISFISHPNAHKLFTPMRLLNR